MSFCICVGRNDIRLRFANGTIMPAEVKLAQRRASCRNAGDNSIRIVMAEFKERGWRFPPEFLQKKMMSTFCEKYHVYVPPSTRGERCPQRGPWLLPDKSQPSLVPIRQPRKVSGSCPNLISTSPRPLAAAPNVILPKPQCIVPVEGRAFLTKHTLTTLAGITRAKFGDGA